MSDLIQLSPCKCGAQDGWTERRVAYYEQHFDEHGYATYASDGDDRKRGAGGAVKRCVECTRVITHLIGPRPTPQQGDEA